MPADTGWSGTSRTPNAFTGASSVIDSRLVPPGAAGRHGHPSRGASTVVTPRLRPGESVGRHTAYELLVVGAKVHTGRMTTYQGPVTVVAGDVEASMQADLSITERDRMKSWGGCLADYEDADMFKVLTVGTAFVRLPDGQEGRFVLKGKLAPGQAAMGVIGSGPAPF
ncbi:hypothetical protein EES45_00445 [Streptomyces sp. ADI97-07]|nr:hypothetical protein ASD51_27110 [Streptomyces sp. Root55]RPK86143.1 hypothetical protein EES45_00445 [Streptomyces sp. ADI97-07]